MKLSKKSFSQRSTALTVIVVLAIISIGYYSLGSRSNQKTPSETFSKIENNWKVYVNTKYSYTFQYPSSWTNEAGENADIVDLFGPGISDQGSYQAQNFLLRIFKKENNPNTNKMCVRSYECYAKEDLIKVAIGKYEGFQTKYYLPVEGGVDKAFQVRVIFFEKDGSVYSLSQQYITAKESEFSKFFDKIVESFKSTT